MSENNSCDTIAAIATASSDAGIGIIRISGTSAGHIIYLLFRRGSELSEDKKYGLPVRTYVSDPTCNVGILANPDSNSNVVSLYWKPNTIHYGYIVDPDSLEVLDEVLVSWMSAPHSYTKEDTVEINTHGGQFVLHRVLSAVLRAGARIAEPGEFTKRAFLNGRIDLSEAEAVMDLIHSRSEFARQSAMSQLSGAVSSSIRELRSEILHELAFIESALDDPEHFSLVGYPSSLDSKCIQWISILQRWLVSSENGRIWKDGICTVIVGKPNAGKSSLLNALMGTDRAIVTEIPGTTRDTLEETVRYNDLILKLVDTAGIRETQDEVERIGVNRSIQAISTAQLILFILDSSVEISIEDYRIANLTADAVRDGRKCVILLNKTDLPSKINVEDISALYSSDFVPDILSLSLKTGDGLDSLYQFICRSFLQGEFAESSEVILTAERQIAELRNASSSLYLVRQSVHAGLSEEFYTIDLQEAYASLGRILGEEVEDDLVDEIFSHFCIGK